VEPQYAVSVRHSVVMGNFEASTRAHTSQTARATSNTVLIRLFCLVRIQKISSNSVIKFSNYLAYTPNKPSPSYSRIGGLKLGTAILCGKFSRVFSNATFN